MGWRGVLMTAAAILFCVTACGKSEVQETASETTAGYEPVAATIQAEETEDMGEAAKGRAWSLVGEDDILLTGRFLSSDGDRMLFEEGDGTTVCVVVSDITMAPDAMRQGATYSVVCSGNHMTEEGGMSIYERTYCIAETGEEDIAVGTDSDAKQEQ